MAIDKNAVIKEAQKLAAKGQFDKAIAEWKKIAKETPNDANVFNTIGDLCLKKNSKPEAVDAYQKAGDILAADGFTSKAIALYKKVLNIDPKKIEAHLALADMNAEKGLSGNALESYKIVADHYLHNHQTAKALGIYQKMADLNTANAGFRLKLADMYAKEGMKKEAIAAYLQAADVHVAKEAFKDARQIFEKALSVDPNNKDVYHKAGLVYFKEGKFVEACKALKPAFESDPSNTELSDLYLDALTKAGRGAEAAETYRKILDKDPSRMDLREKLYRLYLSEQDFDRAFAEVSSLANVKIAEKNFEAAEQILKEFLDAAPRSVDGRRALAALYKTVGRSEEAGVVQAEAAGILLADGDPDGARELAAKAAELAPERGEVKQLVAELQPAAARSEPEPVSPPAEPAEPEPVFELEPVEAPPKPAPKPAAVIPPRAVEAPEQPASPKAAPAARTEVEDPIVIEAMTEIDVLLKYGLSSKALEQLETLAKKYPKSIQLRIKLRDVYGDQGNMGKAVEHMLVLSDLYSDMGRVEDADRVLQAAQEMDPGHPQLRAKLGLPSSEAAAAAPAPLLEEAQPEAAPVLEEIPPLADADQFLSGPDMEAPPGEVPALAQENPAETGVPEGASFEQALGIPEFPGDLDHLSIQEPSAPAQAPEPPARQETAAASPAAEMPAPAAVNIEETLAEAEFYYQQGLFDEARKHYEKVLQHAPGNQHARGRLTELERDQEDAQAFTKLAEAVDGLEALSGAAPAGAGTGEMAVSASDEEAVRMLMQEIAQLKKPAPATEKPAAPQRPAASARPAAAAPAVRREEDFFDLGTELNQINKNSGAAAAAAPAAAGEDDFFDLASELRDELSGTPVPAAPVESGGEQSLDDIFEEFKKGVEQQAIKEDVDTHYNLGIAYKEMGLLDDAITEFLMTPENEPKFIQSRYMLGLCYLEKGDYQSAVGEIDQALKYAESAGVSEQDRIGMFYDLGLAYQGAGNGDSAVREFKKVLQLDRGYRDAAAKVQELEQGGEISLEQLKDDIEREISFKFLEEGERIEREEKTRKNEKVRH